jgi:hypothetical protein
MVARRQALTERRDEVLFSFSLLPPPAGARFLAVRGSSVLPHARHIMWQGRVSYSFLCRASAHVHARTHACVCVCVCVRARVCACACVARAQPQAMEEIAQLKAEARKLSAMTGMTHLDVKEHAHVNASDDRHPDLVPVSVAPMKLG